MASRRWLGRVLVLLTVLLALGIAGGLVWTVLLAWRPAEFRNIYALDADVRREWGRQFDRAVSEFISRVDKGEPFTFTLSENAINGLLATRLTRSIEDLTATRFGLDEVQVALADGVVVFMARAEQTGSAWISLRIRIEMLERGLCTARIDDARVGAVPMDQAFIEDRTRLLAGYARGARQKSRRLLERHPTSHWGGRYGARAGLLEFAVARLRGERLALRGQLGERLEFVVEGLRVEPGAIVLDIAPVPDGANDRPPAQDG